MNTRMKAALAAGALLIATGAGFGVGQAYQPHMGAALSDLQAAQNELNQAIPDKGGHRVAALSLAQPGHHASASRDRGRRRLLGRSFPLKNDDAGEGPRSEMTARRSPASCV